MQRDPAPASPPEAMLTKKNMPKLVLGLYLGKSALIESLKAKLNPCVGK